MKLILVSLVGGLALLACVSADDGSQDKVIAQEMPVAAEAVPVAADAEGDAAKDTVAVDRWLIAGPLPLPERAFDERDAGKRTAAILSAGHIDRSAWIEEGAAELWLPGSALQWSEIECGAGAIEFNDDSGGASPKVAYLSCYVTLSRWQKATVTVKGTRPFALFVDGKEKARSTKLVKEDGEPAEAKAVCALIRGKHRLLVKTVQLDGEGAAPWSMQASVKPGPGAGPETISVDLSPKRTFADMAESNNLASAGPFALSPDGRHLAVVLSEKKPGVLDPLRRLLILEMPSGRQVDAFDATAGVSDIKWAPDGRTFAFKRRGDILRYEPSSRRTFTVLAGVKGLGKYVWSPDGQFIYYAVRGEKKKERDDYVRLDGLHSRLTDYKETKTLHVATVHGGARHALIETGSFAIEDFALSPDGRSMAFVKRFPVTGRPFFRTEFWLLHLPAGRAEMVLETTFPFENQPSNLTWSPDGKRIAFTGPPDQLGETDRRSEVEHNFFETDLWILDIGKKALSRLSDRFDENVSAPIFWHPDDGHIYFKAHRRTREMLARIEVDDPGAEDGAGDGEDGEESAIEMLNEEPAVVHSVAAAAGGDAFAFTGSSIDRAPALFYLDADGGSVERVLDPSAAFMEQMELGRWERCDFTNSRGLEIDGFLFYPPDFEEGKKYPLVVYYYGGTSPQMERFSITYYHFITANGYMLYTLNPSGAVGYGESFSDLHVNDQGLLAGDDIIEGVEKLLADKDFIDAGNVAGYGGSYGGFMTLSLITRTDLFKASCSLYGISNIASYWGAGIWGYTYGDTAVAQSYPWNRPDIFVQRSPLYNADKVQSALLLMHGTDDVNVPAVESEQMFTALKVLGKDVAYLRFPGEDHGIASSRAIYNVHRRIMLEWFDKYLKDQPEAWEERWK